MLVVLGIHDLGIRRVGEESTGCTLAHTGDQPSIEGDTLLYILGTVQRLRFHARRSTFTCTNDSDRTKRHTWMMHDALMVCRVVIRLRLGGILLASQVFASETNDFPLPKSLLPTLSRPNFSQRFFISDNCRDPAQKFWLSACEGRTCLARDVFKLPR